MAGFGLAGGRAFGPRRSEGSRVVECAIQLNVFSFSPYGQGTCGVS